MKDGKPEVLIIAESTAHPTYYYARIKELKNGPKREELLKQIEAAERIIRSEIRIINEFGAKRILFEQVNTEAAERILSDCLKPGKQKEFLNELSKFETERCEPLIKRIREVLVQCGLSSDFSELFRDEFTEAGIWGAKVITRIIYSTGIFDIKFYDDYEAYLTELACTYVFGLFMSNTISELPVNHKLRLIYEELQKQTKNYTRTVQKIWEMSDKANNERDELIVDNIKKMLTDKTVIICGDEHAKYMIGELKDIAHVHPLVFL